MSKFCNNCGTQLEDNDLFCINCGAKVDENNNQPTTPNQVIENNPYNNFNQAPNQAAAPNNKKKRNIIIISAISVVVVVAIIISSVLILGGNSPENLVDTYMECYKGDGSADDLISLVPQEMINYKVANGEKLDEAKNKLTEKFFKNKTNYKDVEWKFFSETDMSLSDVNDINSYCTKYGINITEGKNIKVIVNATDFKGNADSDDFYFEIIKVNGDWYMYRADGSKLINIIF